MTSIVKFSSLAVAAPCSERELSIAPHFTKVSLGDSRGTGLSARSLGTSVLEASRLRGTGLFAPDMREGGERPMQAPAVAAAVAHAYAAAVNGAGAQAKWIESGVPFAGSANVATKTQQTTRAFRGLEPWRDPA
ncbi:hypothetical protein [Wenjunlia tyrosinilytica]|uniref:Uncharacterized protein n=1 Tax=Wenjunlia tyrosinilytica TaxID=1544741 RepID=A0A917ZMP4_9ACTN|nr:hypothetical protein [Wenjunlia tyrosinilytica]GGO85760.1 hypothetical protein GCM10012280_20290 [Wenjunlia tyrosinilytica]